MDLLHRREHVLPLIDLDLHLGNSMPDTAKGCAILVLNTDGRLAGVLVDATREMASLDGAQIWQ